MGNMFLDAADKRTTEFNRLSAAQKKMMVKIVAEIKSDRASENLAYGKLDAYVRAGKEIPIQELADGTQTTDVTLIRADIKGRTAMKVAVKTAQIRQLSPSWTEDWGKKTEQATVGGMKKFGRLAGKFLHAPVQGAKALRAEFLSETGETIHTREDDFLNI